MVGYERKMCLSITKHVLGITRWKNYKAIGILGEKNHISTFGIGYVKNP